MQSFALHDSTRQRLHRPPANVWRARQVNRRNRGRHWRKEHPIASIGQQA